MTKRLYTFDGVKSNLIWDEETTAWTYYSNAPEGLSNNYYRVVPTLYRAVTMIANDVSKMPFRVMRGENIVDNSQEYANEIEFLPNPRKLFGMISMSLDMTGRAYALIVRNKGGYVKEIKYVSPISMTPNFDLRTGELINFTRTVNGADLDYPVSDVLYWWMSDPDVEIGPPMAWPAKAAFAAAGTLANLDTFLSSYFARGAIRPLLVTLDGNPAIDEARRIENWFNSFMTGLKNAFRLKVFRAGGVNTQVIGDGVDQLENTALTTEKRQDIAHAMGIPYALLFSEAANYATLRGDQLFYYENTIEPRCEFIAEVFRHQLFTSASKLYRDYRLEFTPETLDIYQQDENERAESLAKYVGIGFDLIDACDILGVELSDEMRKKYIAKAEENKERGEQLQSALEQSNQQQEPEEEPEENARENDAVRAEIGRLRRKVLKSLRSGKGAAVSFDSKVIPPSMLGAIMGALDACKDEAGALTILNNVWAGYP